MIYANYPRSNSDRLNEASKLGYSQATFYRIADESFDILDTVLDPKKEDVQRIVEAEKKL